MKLAISADDWLSLSPTEAQDALGTQDSERVGELYAALSEELEAAIGDFNPQSRTRVDQLSAILMQIGGSVSVENSIKLLASTCFYYERIGSSYDGIKRGEAARSLAQIHGLKNLERRACNGLAVLYMDFANFDLACQALERTLSLATELGDPFLECVALTNCAAVHKQMGLYHDAIAIANKALSYEIDTAPGRHLRFVNAGNGLFCAHRLRSEEAGLRFLTIGSELIDQIDLDLVSRATFENYRALYLIEHHDHETAEMLLQAAAPYLGANSNPRVEILLTVAESLCDWASSVPARVARSKKELRRIHARSKELHLYHEDVLRALMKVYSRNASRIDADQGMAYATELVSYMTSVKRAKFYRQLSDAGVPTVSAEPDAKAFDPLAGARRWLSAPEGETAPPNARKHQIAKHDELNAIHEELAGFRLVSMRKAIRTAAYDTAENWALAAEFFDDQTGQHCFRVGRLAGMLARELGMDEEFCVRIEHAARLHDIGKIGVNEMILLKPGPLDPSELTAMRAHAELGAHLLSGATDPTLRMAAVIAKYHHEWWNGAGYPSGLRSESIPIEARICAFADVYDALTNARSYKGAWSHRSSVEQMVSETGTHFDPSMVSPFLRVLERYLPSVSGSVMNDQIVQDMNANRLLNSRRNLMEIVNATR